MSVSSALTRLQTAGLALRSSDDGQLLVAPAKALTDNLREYIRANKFQILDALVAIPEQDGKCAHCIHLKRPGSAEGYCCIRDDLPLRIWTGAPVTGMSIRWGPSLPTLHVGPEVEMGCLQLSIRQFRCPTVGQRRRSVRR